MLPSSMELILQMKRKSASFFHITAANSIALYSNRLIPYFFFFAFIRLHFDSASNFTFSFILVDLFILFGKRDAE